MSPRAVRRGLVGHTWDTLVYEPNIRRSIHGTGAHCANDPWLHSQFTGLPLDEVKKQMARSLDQQAGAKSYRAMWLFDPAEKKWIHYESDSPLANLARHGGDHVLHPRVEEDPLLRGRQQCGA